MDYGLENFMCVGMILNNYDIMLLAYENENENFLKDIIKNIKLENKEINIGIIIGPEGGIEEQTKQVFANLQAVLEEAGSGFDKVIKTTCFLKDMNDFAVVNEIYGGYFEGEYPSRSAVQVAKLPKDVMIEIEAIAYI
mgnify:CR=1 FL=1